MSNLVITISADAKKFDDAVKDIEKQTEGLEGKLAGIAKISGAAFAGLVASAGFAVKAFADSEKASKSLELALKNQGIASDKLIANYKDMATELSLKTGIDDDAIVSGEAVLQNFLGQTEASSELLEAMANLSVKRLTAM
jgi:hypothetical protein